MSITAATDFGMEEQKFPGDGVVPARARQRPAGICFPQDFTVFGGSLTNATRRRSARSWTWR